MNSQQFIDAFESPSELVRSAREANEHFKEALQLELQKLKIEVVEDSDLNPGLMTHRISVYGKPSIGLRKIGYNILSDCRHALDQVVVSASKALGSSKNSEIYFPFATDEAEFDDLLKRGRYKNIHPALHQTLRDIKPWWETDEPNSGDDFLRTLCKLSGPNKHQVIIGFGPELEGMSNPNFNASQTLIVCVPPKRSDMVGELHWHRTFPGRTDFIYAITKPTVGDIVEFDSVTFTFCAPESGKFSDYAIDTLFDIFVDRTEATVERIKHFVLHKVAT